MKRVLIALMLILAGGVVAWIYFPKEEKYDQKAMANSIQSFKYVSPTISAPAGDLIKNLFVKKYDWDLNKIELSVKNDLVDYASGSVRNTDEAGGAMWFAAKVNGNWELVFDGNGIITCTSLNKYPSFPTSLIPECYDDSTSAMVKR